MLKPGGEFVFTDTMQSDDYPYRVLAPVLDYFHLTGGLLHFLWGPSSTPRVGTNRDLGWDGSAHCALHSARRSAARAAKCCTRGVNRCAARSRISTRSVAVFRAPRNGVHPISGANNGATAIAFGGPRSSCVRPGAHSARHQDSRDDLTPCRMAWHFVSDGAHRRTPTKRSALRLRRGRRTPLGAYAPSLPCAPPSRLCLLILKTRSRPGAKVILPGKCCTSVSWTRAC